MFDTFNLPLTWRQLIQKTVKDANDDNILGLAAQLAFYFLLALVPAIVCLAALASFVPADILVNTMAQLRGVVPTAVIEIVSTQLESIGGGSNSGVFTVGLLFALWSSSAALVGVCDALNRAYDIEEARPWWRVRLIAILLTVALAVFVVLSITLVLIGPTIAEQIAARVGLGDAFAWTWAIVQWPVVFLLIATAIGLIYYFAPDAEQDWEWITPGAVAATLLWLVASLGFKIYVSQFADYNATYGSLGGVMVLMFWFYLTALAILFGAEMNAEIEHASPHGKEAGEKRPGERKKIGRAAARAFAERRRLPQASVAAYGILALGLFTRLRKPAKG